MVTGTRATNVVNCPAGFELGLAGRKRPRGRSAGPPAGTAPSAVLLVPFLLRPFSSTVCSPLRAFRNLIQTSGNSPFFTLLTDDFIKPRTVGQLPDSATSLVSLSILGKISILDKWEGCSSRLPRPRVPEGYAYLSTFRSFFPSSSF